MDSLEEQSVLVDPYQNNVNIKMISPCFLRVKARAKEKDLNDCDLSEIRWIISPSQLHPFLRQLQTKNYTKEGLFMFKAERLFCIEFDSYDRYFQNQIHEEEHLEMKLKRKMLLFYTADNGDENEDDNQNSDEEQPSHGNNFI